MKKIFILALASLSFVACRNANTNNPTASTVSVGNDTTSKIASPNAPIMTFERDIFDFGKIKQGELVQHDFKFKNTGKSPLIVSNATATCGCTVPQVPGEPILPGKEGSIKVVFNSTGKMDMQDKIVTITSNANPTVSKVHLVGEVLAK